MLSARRATWSGPWRRPSHPHFYPRPPRGGRRPKCGDEFVAFTFLSTPSVRRATVQVLPDADFHIISIHALREEGDPMSESNVRSGKRFLSTPSVRRATPLPRK